MTKSKKKICNGKNFSISRFSFLNMFQNIWIDSDQKSFFGQNFNFAILNAFQNILNRFRPKFFDLAIFHYFGQKMT